MFKNRRTKDLFIIWSLFGLCAALVWPALTVSVALAYSASYSQTLTGVSFLLLFLLLCFTVSLFCLGVVLTFFKKDLKSSGIFKVSAIVLGIVAVFLACVLITFQ